MSDKHKFHLKFLFDDVKQSIFVTVYLIYTMQTTQHYTEIQPYWKLEE